MRVQYTLKDSTVTAIRHRAESLGIHPSRLVEEYLTAALRSTAALTLTPQSRASLTAVDAPGGSKPTTTQSRPGEMALEELFVDVPPRAPAVDHSSHLGEPDDLEAATDAAVPLHR